jgi:hypothetical protein
MNEIMKSIAKLCDDASLIQIRDLGHYALVQRLMELRELVIPRGTVGYSYYSAKDAPTKKSELNRCDCTPGTEDCGRKDCTHPYAKIKMTKEWCLAAADREAGSAVGAGAPHDRSDCPCGHPPGTKDPCGGCNCADDPVPLAAMEKGPEGETELQATRRDRDSWKKSSDTNSMELQRARKERDGYQKERDDLQQQLAETEMSARKEAVIALSIMEILAKRLADAVAHPKFPKP